MKALCEPLCHCASVVKCRKCFFLVFLFVHSTFISAQQNIITVGIQYKPVFTIDFLNTGDENVLQNGVDFSIGLHSGFAGGMVIRRGITDTYSIEGGINYIKRKYAARVTDGNFSEETTYSIIGYEIPLSGLVYIRLSEQFYMNASLGVAADMFASNLETFSTYFETFSLRKSVITAGVIANLGWEMRTDKSGYFYIGASYHNPFSDIYITRIEYDNNNKQEAVEIPLTGTYLTLDLRYFFREDPIKKKRKTEDEE